MVVDVGLFAMLLLLLILAEVMAMRQLVLVMDVRMPGGPMLPLPRQIPAMVVGEMIVIVAVDLGWVRMLMYPTLAFDVLLYVLLHHCCAPFIASGGRHPSPSEERGITRFSILSSYTGPQERQRICLWAPSIRLCLGLDRVCSCGTGPGRLQRRHWHRQGVLLNEESAMVDRKSVG